MSGNRCEPSFGTRRLGRCTLGPVETGIRGGCTRLWYARSSPSLGEPAVLPIPEKIKQDLNVSSGCIGGWYTNANIRADVLASAESHLHLWHNIPIGFRPGLEIAIRDELHHGRPLPSEAM